MAIGVCAYLLGCASCVNASSAKCNARCEGQCASEVARIGIGPGSCSHPPLQVHKSLLETVIELEENSNASVEETEALLCNV